MKFFHGYNLDRQEGAPSEYPKFFTSDFRYAVRYSLNENFSNLKKLEKSYVIEADIDMTKYYEVDSTPEIMDLHQNPQMVQKLKDLGYRGAKVDYDDGEVWVLVFFPEELQNAQTIDLHKKFFS